MRSHGKKGLTRRKEEGDGLIPERNVSLLFIAGRNLSGMTRKREQEYIRSVNKKTKEA